MQVRRILNVFPVNGMTLALIALMVFSIEEAKANVDFSYTFSNASMDGSGTLVAADNGDGTYTGLSGSAAVLSGGQWLTFTLEPAQGTPYPGFPGNYYSQEGLFIFDDILYPSSNPTLDESGLVFSVSLGSEVGEVNIVGIPGSPDTYEAMFASNSGGSDENYVPVSFTLSQVPEPATLSLAGLGLLAIAAGRRKVKQQYRIEETIGRSRMH